MCLLEAINDNDLRRVQELIANGSCTEQIASQAELLLGCAQIVENLEIITALIEAGASPNWSSLGDELLITAIMEEHVELVNTLISAGAIVNKTDEDGITPLMCAAANSSLEIVQTLVENGAEVNAVGEYEDFALLSAAINERQEIFNYLAPLTSSKLREKLPPSRYNT